MLMSAISDDSGVVALAQLLAIHQISVDAVQLRHDTGHKHPLSADDILRLAKRVDGIKAKSRKAAWDDLPRMAMPALGDGPEGWFLIGAAKDDHVLIQRPASPVEKISRERLEAIWSGDIILIASRESGRLARRSFDVTWFIPQIVKYRRLIGEILLVTLMLNLLGLAAPLFFQSVVDKVLVHETISTLTVLVIGFVGVSCWETAFAWLRTRLYSETTQKMDVELGAKLFRHLLQLPLSYFEMRRVGDTAMRVRQLETVREFLTNASMTVLIDPLFTIVFLIAMAAYSIKLFIVAVAALPAFFLVALLATGPLRARLDEKFEQGAANNALLIESIAGIQTIKASSVEPQWRDRWERQLAAYSTASQRVIDIGNSGSQAIQLISKLNMAAILYFGAQAVMAHDLTVGGLIAFNMFAQRVSGPVIRMAQLWQDFQQVRLAIQRLGDVLNHRAEPGAGSQAALPAIAGHVEFQDVTFRYADDGPWTIEDINLNIAAGSTIGIVGSSGSGKSTLTKLIQRLYLPARGRVLIDGIDLSQINPVWLRRQIGVVLQENVLFNRTIRENIALADPAAPVDSVIAAAKLAGAHDFVTSLPHGYDTMIEERGSNLSGGQRQRLAIARALHTDPRILIFDEATSALDAESEEIIQQNLSAMAKGRTVIIIAHRLSAIRQCDTIVTLERGRIVEQGSHAELLAKKGRYSDLHRRQLGIASEVDA